MGLSSDFVLGVMVGTIWTAACAVIGAWTGKIGLVRGKKLT